MTDATGTPADRAVVERRSPEATFALLGDDTRIEILRSMGETPNDPVSFSALQDSVGTPDSGQFNYHLKKLVGAFVRKTEDGYELTYAGRQIVGAMHAGTYTANATVEQIPIDGSCPMCGSDITASYADEQATVSCTACDDWLNEFSFPPGSLDQFPLDELSLAFDRWMFTVIRQILAGFCVVCAGRMRGELVLHDTEDAAEQPTTDGGSGTASEPFGSLPAHIAFECDRCGSQARTGPATPLSFHPAMQGFLFEHGIETDRTPSWEIPEALANPVIEILESTPPLIELTVEYDGERIQATLDDAVTISDVERTPLA